jgi:hypothetical protein
LIPLHPKPPRHVDKLLGIVDTDPRTGGDLRGLYLSKLFNPDSIAGKMLAVCTGEVRAFTRADNEYKVVALMQATIANIRHALTSEVAAE